MLDHKNKQLILKKIVALHTLFHQGRIPTLAQHEVNPNLDESSRENYLYFTLPPCINFQRNSPAMWSSALKTYNDPETRYLFMPEEVTKHSRDKIQKDLLKYKLALQLNKHTDIWITISKALHDLYNNDPRQLLKAGNLDVVQIQEIIQQKQRKNFPYLSGPKMANYWLYILSHYTDIKLSNMQEISIIPDTHVLQSTIKLGLAETLISPQVAAELWKEILFNSDISPVEMHPVLWNWSRNGFNPEV